MSITCLSIFKDKRNEDIPHYLTNDEFSTTTIDINDICDVIKSDITYNRYKKNCKILQIFHSKMYKEIDDMLHSNQKQIKQKQELDKIYDEDSVFTYILSILQHNHIFLCKLVSENMDKIKERLENDKKLYDKNNIKFYEKYYDYSMITNILWNYRFTYARKIFENKLQIYF